MKIQSKVLKKNNDLYSFWCLRYLPTAVTNLLKRCLLITYHGTKILEKNIRNGIVFIYTTITYFDQL